MTSMKRADLCPLLEEYGKSMQTNLQENTSSIHGHAYTCHPIPDGVATWEWFNVVKVFHVELGHIVTDVLSYYNADRDPLTCPYHLLNIPGPNAEWGVEVKWQ